MNDTNSTQLDRVENALIGIGKLLAIHTSRFDNIEKRLKEHSKLLAEHTGMLDHQAKILDQHMARFNKIDTILVEHTHHFQQIDIRLSRLETRFDNLPNIFVTKNEFNEFRDFNLTRLDHILGIVERNDQERLVMTHILDRHDLDIAMIKDKLSLA